MQTRSTLSSQRALRLFAAAVLALSLTACGSAPAPGPESGTRGGGLSERHEQPAGGHDPARGRTVNTSARGAAMGSAGQRGNTPEGIAYADHIRSTDPEKKFILDAFVRDNQTLGVIMSPTMTRARVQEAMNSLFNGMAQRFPNRDIQVIAYYESGDELARATAGRQGQPQITWKH